MFPLVLPTIRLHVRVHHECNCAMCPCTTVAPVACICHHQNCAVQVNFETAMVLKDVFTGGKRSFQTEGHAREFRAQLYENHGLKAPTSSRSGTVPPKVQYSFDVLI